MLVFGGVNIGVSPGFGGLMKHGQIYKPVVSPVDSKLGNAIMASDELPMPSVRHLALSFTKASRRETPRLLDHQSSNDL